MNDLKDLLIKTVISLIPEWINVLNKIIHWLTHSVTQESHLLIPTGLKI